MTHNEPSFFDKMRHFAMSRAMLTLVVPQKYFVILGALAVISTISLAQVARESWWDRTSKTMFVATSHRIRSDLPAKTNVSTAEGIDRLWFTIDAGLGQLRPRSRGLQQALLFTTQEDLSEIMRSQFAVDAPSEAFAFFSPL